MTRLLGWLRRCVSFDVRDHWWHLLDLLEAKRRLRWSLYAALLMGIITTVAAIWIYPWWNQRNAIHIARGWLAAGRLDQASLAVKDALNVAPERPESWQLAASLARLRGNQSKALDCSRHAAGLDPGNLNLTLEWSSDALIDDQPDEAAQALATLHADAVAASPHAQRMLGEIARRSGDLSSARDHFETALALDGPLPVDEVPLGIILLKARDKTTRQDGIDLLAKWSSDREWGANALRALLTDALLHDDRPAMLARAAALRAHPRCTLGDIPNCLLALSRADPAHFSEVLSILEKKYAVDSGNIALLLGWLNRIDRAAEALAWTKNLPPVLTGHPPAAVGVAESLRLLTEWPALLDWTGQADWGTDLQPVRLSYELLAARKLDRTNLAAELWKTLQARAQTDGGRALFTADTLYAWGLRPEAITLLWIAAEQADSSVNALGTLARHYQIEDDVAGQFRVFKRLHSIRANDPSIANNYAYFSALTGNDLDIAEKCAAAALKSSPANPSYRSTYALVLCVENRPDDALALLKPLAPEWRKLPMMVLPYGLALTGTGQKAEARAVLSTLDLKAQPPEVAALVKAALD